MLLEILGGHPFRSDYSKSNGEPLVLGTKRDYRQPDAIYLSGTYVYVVPTSILTLTLKTPLGTSQQNDRF